MAKKVILKDLNDIEVLPITRGELVLDASGNPALHSTLFLATDSLPGLMSSEDKYKLDHLEESGPGANNKVAQINTTTNDVYRLLFSETADDTDRTEGSRKSANLTFNPSTGVLNLTGVINANGGTLNDAIYFNDSKKYIRYNSGSYLEIFNETNSYSGLGLYDDGSVKVYTNSKWNAIIHSGNIGSQSVDSANKLKNKVKIWSLDFDGTADINGNLELLNYIAIQSYRVDSTKVSLLHINNSDVVTIGDDSCKTNIRGTNVGIGVTDPKYKLDVNGVIRASSHLITNARVKILDGLALEWNDTAANGSTSNLLLPRKNLDYRLDYYDGTNWHLLAYKTDIPTKTSQLTNDSGYVTGGPYLPLSGGTISGTYGALTIHRTNENSSLIKYSNTSGVLGYLGFYSSKEPFVFKGTDTTTPYKIWHEGNDGSGSGLNADMLDGKHLSSFITYELTTDYVGASFNSEDLSKKAASTYIEYWDGAGGWFNSRWGLVLAISGFHRVGSSDSYVLLGGGGHKALSTLQSEYDGRYVNVTGDTMTGTLSLPIVNITKNSGNDAAILFSGGNSEFFDRCANLYLSSASISWNVSNQSLSNRLLTVMRTGNVGIGTTAPIHKLQVAGAGVFNNTGSTTYATNGITIGAGDSSVRYITCYGKTGSSFINVGYGPGANNSAEFAFSYTSDGSASNYTMVSMYGAANAIYVYPGYTLSKKNISAPNYISTAATGALPYACTSTTLNTNLNADLLDGYHAGSFLLRGRMTNPSNGTSYHGAIPYAIALKAAGTPVYTDPEFASGTNSVSVYNNSGNSTVAISRIADNQGSANSSGYILQIVNNGGPSWPGRGGFYQSILARQNAVFAQIFRAKIPTGFSVVNVENPMGSGYTTFWLTDTAGTGKWEWYIRITICGNGGTYSGGGHVYLNGSGAVTWYLAYCNLIDLTKGNYDGLRAKYCEHSSTVTVNNSDANSTYRMVWHSGNTLYSTAGIYCNPSTDCLYASHYYETSDIAFKTNIKPILNSDNIPVLKSFDWKSDGSHSYGLIALELEEMGYPELVSEGGGYKTVNYSAALSLIVGKLQVKIKELEKEIENLKNKN